MASIQSIGAGSGLLTNQLIADIIRAERDATDLRLSTRRAEIDARLSALGSVRSAVDQLARASRAVADPTLYTRNAASSSRPDLFAATATGAAVAGVHAIEVRALASAQSLASRRFDDPGDATGTGALTFRFGTTTFDGGGAYASFTVNDDAPGGTVTIEDGDDTLAGVRDAVNEAGIGVLASIVNDGGGYRLVVRAADTGAEHSIEIVAAEGAEAGLSAFAFNAGNATPDVNLMQTAAAADASLVVDGLQVTRASNSVDGVIAGVTLSLAKAEIGTVGALSVSLDKSAAITAVQSYVDRFNSLTTLTGALTAYDPDTEVAGLLLGDAGLRTLLRQVRGVTGGAVAGLSQGARRTLVEVGVRTGADNRLAVDATRLSAALQESPLDVASLFAATGRSSDALTSVTGFGNASPGVYAVEVARLASSAVLDGSGVPALAGPITIDADNDTLTVHVDGHTSGEVALTHGVFASGAALAAEIEVRINEDATLRASSTTVSVTFDALRNRLQIASLRLGGASTVGIVAVDADTAAEFGLTIVAASQNAGLNAIGRINGIVATGSGNALAVPGGAVAARSGFLAGTRTEAFATALTVDSSNDVLAVSVDGIASGSIALTHGSYASGASLATELQTRINADAALTGGGRSVTVVYDDATHAFSIVSAASGSTSRVDLESIDASLSTTLGIAVGDGVAGHAGSTRADDAAGITIRVDGGAIGARGEVSIVRGVMDRLTSVLTDALANGGVIDARIDGLDDRIADLDAESVRFNARIGALEERLRTQFAAADALIAQLNSTSTFLTQQLQFLPELLSRNQR